MKRFIAGLLCFVLVISNIGPSIVHATETQENEMTEFSDADNTEIINPEDQELNDENISETTGSENIEFNEEIISEDSEILNNEESIEDIPEEIVEPALLEREPYTENELADISETIKASIESENFFYDEFINTIHATGYFYNILKRLGEETRLFLYEKLTVEELYSLLHISKYEYLNELVYPTDVTETLVDEYYSYIEIYTEILNQAEWNVLEIAEISDESKHALEQKNYEVLTSHIDENISTQYQNHDLYMDYLVDLTTLDLIAIYENIMLIDPETEDSLTESLKGFKDYLYAVYGFDVPEDEEEVPDEIPDPDLDTEENIEANPDLEENDSTDSFDIENKNESIEPEEEFTDESATEDENKEEQEENPEISSDNQEFIIGFEDYDWESKTAYMTLTVDEEERTTIESLLPETVNIILEQEAAVTSDSESLLPELDSNTTSLGIDLQESADETLQSNDLLKKTVTLPVSWVTDKNIEDTEEKEFIYNIQLNSEEYDFNDTIKEKLDTGEYVLPFIEIHITDKTEIVDFVNFNEEGYDPYTTISFNNEERSIVNDYLAEYHTTIPAKLGDGSIQEIPAAWVCDSDIETTMFGLYTYRLVIPEGYHLSAELQEKYDNYDIMLPFIDVSINTEDRFNRASLTRYKLIRDAASPNYIYLFAYISSPSGTQKVYAGPNNSVSLNNMTSGSWSYDGLSYNYMYAIPIVSGRYGLYCFNISLNGSTNAGRVNFIAGNAMIGSTFYNTMSDAVAAASNGATIELLRADCREYDYSFLANKAITIRPSSSNTITSEGYTATVRNSGEAVTVNLPTKNGQNFFIRNHTGTLTLSGYGSYNLNFDGANLTDPNTSQEDPIYSAICTLASSASYATTNIKSGVNIYNVGRGAGDGYGIGHGDASVHDANITINIESGVNIYNNSTGVGGSGTTKITGGNFYNNDKDGVLVLADNASTSATITGGSFFGNGARGIAFGGLETISTSGLTHRGDISGATVYGNGTHGVFINTSTNEKWDVTVYSSTIRDNTLEGFYVYNGIGRFISGNIYGNGDDGIGLYSANSICYMSGGNVYSNGSTGTNAGGAWIYNGTFNMSGGSIYSNTGYYGGGVYVNSTGTFNLTGGSIYSNTSASYGKGVYQGGTMTMKGSGVVNANNDVYLVKDHFVTVNGALTGTATITPDSYWCFRKCVEDTYSAKGSTYLSNFTLTPNSPYLFAAGDKMQSGSGVAAKDIVITRTYTITYNANGGTNAPASQTYVYYGDNINLRSEKPSWSNRDFLGWSLDSTATTKSYDPGQAWGSSNGADYTLYAVWKEAVRDAKVTGCIKASDYYSEHGNPTFFYKMSGKDGNGKEHIYYQCITFTQDYVSANTNAEGYVEATAVFSGVPAGKYTITQDFVSRYQVKEVRNIQNSSISGEIATYDLVNNEIAHAAFINQKYEWQDCSDACR